MLLGLHIYVDMVNPSFARSGVFPIINIIKDEIYC